MFLREWGRRIRSICGAVLLLVGCVLPCAAAPASVGRGDMGRFLALLDAGFDAAKVDLVVQFANDPNGTYAQHKRAMEENGFEEPYPNIYLDIVIDHMSERERLVRLDWKAGRDDISWAAETLSGGRVKALLDDRAEEEDTNALLALASDRLAKQGYAFLCIDDGSDSYPAFLVPAKSAKSVIDAAAKCGIRVLSVKDA